MCIAPDLLTQRFATQALNVTPQLKMVSHRLVICGTEYVLRRKHTESPKGLGWFKLSN